MKKIKFIYDKDHDYKTDNVLNDTYLLLYYFVNTYNTQWDLPEVIRKLSQVRSGQKTFAEIQNPQVAWQIGAERQGEFECDKDTAYFISDYDSAESFEMPLQELIDLLKEWQAFLKK